MIWPHRVANVRCSCGGVAAALWTSDDDWTESSDTVVTSSAEDTRAFLARCGLNLADPLTFLSAEGPWCGHAVSIPPLRLERARAKWNGKPPGQGMPRAPVNIRGVMRR